MKLSHPTLTFSFFKTTTETDSVNEYEIVKNSFSFKEQLLNGLESSSNMVTLKLKRGCSVIEKILNYQVDTKVVLRDGSTKLFTGYLSDNYTWKVNTDGEQEFQITIEDIGTKLLGKAFLTMSAPSLYNLNGKVFSGQNNILQQICDRAGITIKSGQLAPEPSGHEITTEINANIDKNMTCKELLGGILLECGYAYYFDENGELCLYKIDCESVTGIPELDKDNLWVVNGNAITLTKKVRQYKQVNVSYDEYERRTGVLVYKDITGQDADQGYPDCHITIKPNAYYPIPLLDVATVQDMQHLGTGDVDLGDYVRVTSTDKVYTVVQLGDPDADIDGDSYSFIETTVNEVSFVEAEDIDKGREVISISNVYPTVTYVGTIYQDITQRGAKSIAVEIKNTGNSDAEITKLQATASIVDIKSKGIIVAGESAGTEHSENVYSTETKYIHTKEYVQNYANLLVSYYKYCNYSYTFYIRQENPALAYPLGSLVHVYDNAFSQLQVDLLLTGRTYNDSTSIYQYTGVAVSPFNLTADVDNEQTLVPDKIGLPGPVGPMGEGVLDITYLYAASSDQTIQPSSSSYGPNIPPLDDTTNRVLWVKTIITYTDGDTEEKVSVGAIYGDPGDPGETGTTVETEYALTYSGVEPVSTDWSEQRDIGWYVGYTYWTRFKFTDGEGNVTYSVPLLDNSMNDIMSSLVSFEISSDVPSYEKDLRSTDPVSITLTANSMKYYIPSFNWTINGISYTGPTVTLNYTKKTAPDNLSISCTLTSSVNNVPYTATKVLLIPSSDKTEYNRNYGVLTVNPSGNFIEGDSYVKQVTDQVTGKIDYLPYVFTNNGWSEITNVAYWPSQIAQIRDVILANGIDIPETSVAIYGYFRILSAQQAQIDTLSSTEIILNRGGVIRSSNYAEDTEGNPTAGFRIDYEGNSAFVKSNVVDSIVSGSFTSNPLETQHQTAGSQITAEWNTTPYYNDGDAFDFILEKAGPNNLKEVSGTYTTSSQTKTISYVLAQNEAQRTEAKALAANNNITSTTTISGTLPVTCNNVRVEGTPLVKSLSSVAFTGSASAVTQYSLDNSIWNNFSGNVTLSRSNGQSVYARQVFTLPAVNYIDPETWTSGTSLSNVRAMAYGNGYIIAVGADTSTHYGIVYRSTDGTTWTEVYRKAGEFQDIAYGNGVFVATAYTLASGSESACGIWTSSDNGSTWTQRFTSPEVSGSGYNQTKYIAYGNGKFKTSSSSVWYKTSKSYESDDNGLTWYQNGDAAGRIAYGNGIFVSCDQGGRPNAVSGGNLNGYITFCNDMFVKATHTGSTNHQEYIYVSTDGQSWSAVYNAVSSTSYASYQNIVYADGYYLWGFDGKTMYSTDLTHWTEGNSSMGSLIYVSGIGAVSGTSSLCEEDQYQDSDWVVSTPGTLKITYDYTIYPTGANLMDSSKTIIATLLDNKNSWRAERTYISIVAGGQTYTYTTPAYYTFKRFLQNGSELPEFDARSYVDNTTFRIKFEAYNRNPIDITTAKVVIGGIDYFYNVKWNGSTLQVFLNGSMVCSFSTGDYFTTGNIITMTPNGQEDGVLVKDVLPKLDSRYSLGASGREFSDAYIDNIHGALTGNVTGNLTGNVTGNVSGSSGSCTGNAATATTASSCSGNSATADRATAAGDGIITVVANNSNEVNFGGTNTSDTIYFGYRATGSRPKPATYYFGSGNGTATIRAAKVYGAVWN